MFWFFLIALVVLCPVQAELIVYHLLSMKQQNDTV